LAGFFFKPDVRLVDNSIAEVENVLLNPIYEQVSWYGNKTINLGLVQTEFGGLNPYSRFRFTLKYAIDKIGYLII
jgi:hypothetical protein